MMDALEVVIRHEKTGREYPVVRLEFDPETESFPEVTEALHWRMKHAADELLIVGFQTDLDAHGSVEVE